MSTNKGTILLVEDEVHLHEALKLNLEMEGYTVVSAFDGAEALQLVTQEYFDLLILDIMLPEVNGISVAETLRVNHLEMPILMLSAKNTSADRVLGLKKGADDYMTKPFDLEELLLRVEKLIEKSRRLQTKEQVGDTYSFGGNCIDFKSLQATNFRGEQINLTKREAMLLKLLIENKGEVVTREKILLVVWGYQVYPTTRTIDNFILNFRKYFEQDSKSPAFFHSVRGMGYRFAQ
ncbi:MAG: response regulator transcription factor [Sediminibacterium sp.]|nr:response regulator transcription factor [Hydrotalea sp.]MCU0336442.1 response regulator transcription factor [Sediminibacterium sp.]